MKIKLKRSPMTAAACGAVAACAAFGVPAAHAQSGSITNIVYTSQDAVAAGEPAPVRNRACDAPDNANFCHIIVRNTDGTGRAITGPAANDVVPANDVDPAPSPDGTKIAFARRPSTAAAGRYDIWVMDANGGNPVKLTGLPGEDMTRDERYPAWSPDGSKIAYRGYTMPEPIGGSSIFTMNPDGGAKAAIPNTFGGDQPTWSPDGMAIAYSARPDAASLEDIFVQSVTAPTASPTNLTLGSAESDRYPSWQPVAGSSEILFRRVTTNNRQLWRWNASAGVQNLSVAETGSIGRAATWAPPLAGAPNMVAFVSYVDPNAPLTDFDQEIWLGTVSGTTILGARPITDNEYNDDEPRISVVPAALSPVPPPTGVAGGGAGAAGGGGVVSSQPLTVGGGTLANGRKALALTLTVPKQNLGKKKKTVRATVRCTSKCIVTMSGFTKLKVGSKTKTLRLQRVRKTLNAGVITRVNVRLPLATLRRVRSALRRKKRVTITIQATARTSSGEFTPTAKRKLVLRR